MSRESVPHVRPPSTVVNDAGFIRPIMKINRVPAIRGDGIWTLFYRAAVDLLRSTPGVGGIIVRREEVAGRTAEYDPLSGREDALYDERHGRAVITVTNRRAAGFVPLGT